MLLSQLIQSANLEQLSRRVGPELDPDILSLSDDSRQAGPGVLFVLTEMGLPFLGDALGRSPGALLVSMDLLEDSRLAGAVEAGVPIFAVSNLLSAQGEMASALYGFPSRELELMGVTGTNGKTSVSLMLFHLWSRLGRQAGMIGTLGVRWVNRAGELVDFKTGYTTPRPNELHEVLARMLDEGVTHVIMEVSSEGIDLGRVAGVHFSAALFTNLTRDHLDHHGSMEAYFQAKIQLFLQAGAQGGRLIISTLDEAGKSLANNLELDFAGQVERLNTSLLDGAGLGIEPLFNRLNASLAVMALGPGGLELPGVREALQSLPEIPGRFNLIFPEGSAGPEAGAGPGIFGVVDYAHTPDALLNLLTGVRSMGVTRLVCIVGCGGDRDPGKRGPMGHMAGQFSDFVIVTDDNPRTEDPGPIRQAVVAGAEGAVAEFGGAVQDVGDRREAIAAGVAWCREQGSERVALVLAGKGHEDVQIFVDRKEPFSEHEELRLAFARAEKADL